VPNFAAPALCIITRKTLELRPDEISVPRIVTAHVRSYGTSDNVSNRKHPLYDGASVCVMFKAIDKVHQERQEYTKQCREALHDWHYDN
jgi:hypothetical protein